MLRLRNIIVAAGLALVSLTALACLAADLLTDTMASHTARLGAATGRNDAARALDEVHRIEAWNKTSDYVGWSVAAFIVVGTVATIVVTYFLLFRPLLDLVGSMKRFMTGDREARARPYPSLEMATVGCAFNEMADVIVGQHVRMLDFLGRTAQELRAPVQTMKTILRPYVDGGAAALAERERSRLTLVKQQIDRLERLVRTYLDAGKLEWTPIDLNRERKDVDEIVREAVRAFDARAPKHQVDVNLPDEPIWGYVDRGRLIQVFDTLLANAIRRCPGGGRVQVTAHRTDGEAIVDVADDGAAIPDDAIEHVFDPFQRLGAERESRVESVVGMSVARRIVEASEGRIEVTRGAERGTTFRVHVPLAGPSPEPTKASAESCK